MLLNSFCLFHLWVFWCNQNVQSHRLQRSVRGLPYHTLICVKMTSAVWNHLQVDAVWSQLQHFSLAVLETTVSAVQPNNAGGSSPSQLSFAGAHCRELSAGGVLNFWLDLCSRLFLSCCCLEWNVVFIFQVSHHCTTMAVKTCSLVSLRVFIKYKAWKNTFWSICLSFNLVKNLLILSVPVMGYLVASQLQPFHFWMFYWSSSSSGFLLK